MTKNKDFKRLVRARMKKTGESYTAARAQLTRAPARSLAELAGRSDAAIEKGTGRSWVEWVELLDAAGAQKMTHTEIARHVFAEGGVSGWWSQGVAVGYERIRGLRDTNQQRDGEYQAGKSKTISASAAAIFAAFAQKKKRAAWLPDVDYTIRTKIPSKSLRITWPDRTSVEVSLVPKTAKKTVVAIVHRKLRTRAALTEAKTAWGERLGALAAALARH